MPANDHFHTVRDANGQLLRLQRLAQDQIDFVERTFTFHKPKGDQVARYTSLRETAKRFALDVMALTPEGPEQDVALEKLSEASMWANAAIARNE